MLAALAPKRFSTGAWRLGSVNLRFRMHHDPEDPGTGLLMRAEHILNPLTGLYTVYPDTDAVALLAVLFALARAMAGLGSAETRRRAYDEARGYARAQAGVAAARLQRGIRRWLARVRRRYMQLYGSRRITSPRHGSPRSRRSALQQQRLRRADMRVSMHA